MPLGIQLSRYAQAVADRMGFIAIHQQGCVWNMLDPAPNAGNINMQIGSVVSNNGNNLSMINADYLPEHAVLAELLATLQ